MFYSFYSFYSFLERKNCSDCVWLSWLSPPVYWTSLGRLVVAFFARASLSIHPTLLPRLEAFAVALQALGPLTVAPLLGLCALSFLYLRLGGGGGGGRTHGVHGVLYRDQTPVFTSLILFPSTSLDGETLLCWRAAEKLLP